MANATIFNQMQLSPESSAGETSPTTATKLLPGFSGEWDVAVETDDFAPDGTKFNVYGNITRRWLVANINSKLDYNSIAYLISGHTKYTAPTLGGSDYTWTVNPARAAADTIKTYRFQFGATGQPVAKGVYGFFKSMQWTFGTKECKVSAAGLAKKGTGALITASGTMDTVGTTLALSPVLPQEVALRMHATYGSLAGSTAVPWKEIRLNFDDVNEVNHFGNATLEWTDHIQTKPKLTWEFDIELSSTNAALYANMQANDKMFASVTCTGSVGTKSLKAEVCGYIVDIKRKNVDGVQCITVKMNHLEDSNLGSSASPYKLTLVNQLSDL